MIKNIFVIVDVLLLVILLALLIIFIARNKKRLSKEGMLYLYKTSWGINLINKIGSKYKKTLGFLSYISIFLGYILMIAMLYLLGDATYRYLTMPEIVQIIRAPPIAPIIPYFPELFGLGDLFPPFYAIYFIVSILIVATVHEFSHGIFARRWNVKIKTTGFAFFRYFPALFGAFVEQDDRQMTKKSKFEQLSILSAGVFANIVTAIIFFFVITSFFYLAFVPAGVTFNTYTYSYVPVADISSVNGIALDNPSYENILNLTNEEGFNKIKANSIDYVTTKKFIQKNEGNPVLVLYHDAPAVNIQLEDTIMEVNGVKIHSIGDLSMELSKYSPGEKVTLNVLGSDEEPYSRDIILGKNPMTNSSFLGIGFADQSSRNFLGKIYNSLSFKEPNIYYESKIWEIGDFIYYLLWWIVLINILVGLFNMLPVGILDGGRFFYLTVLGIIGNEEITKKIYNSLGYFIFFVFLLLMIRWAISFF
ncbi:site-2 protease family protein [Candidatus Pacearchaeota archaeon]|nr:site-2 protease family protein [Candidatus Pacearchaeota archaeon]